MILETFPVGPLQCNCSILGDEDQGTAVVIDPGGDAERITSRLQELGLKVTHIVHTHAHLDHIGASAPVKHTCGGEAWLHKGDEWLWENLDTQSRMIGGMMPTPEQVVLDKWMDEGDHIEVAGHKLQIVHTPGHTPGSCTFVMEAEGRQLVFAGDTLFNGSIGRTDLWGGDSRTIIESLRGKLMALDDDAEVVCGHGPGTTIGFERRNNPFITGAINLF